MSPEDLRRALGHFTTGVTVVTTRSDAGEPVGTTASAVSALSLDPPLVIVCLNLASKTLSTLRECGRFALNVLSDGQRHLSDNFARRGEGATWADVAQRTGATDEAPPRLDGALAVLECTVVDTIPGGDHEIVVGEIAELELGDEQLRPLVHFRGAYASLQTALQTFVLDVS